MLDTPQELSPDELAIREMITAPPVVAPSSSLDEQRILGRVTELTAQVQRRASRRGTHAALALVIVTIAVPIAIVGAQRLAPPVSRPTDAASVIAGGKAGSLAKAYHSIAEIGTASDLVIAGTVDRVAGVGYTDPSIPSTVLVVRVEQSLKGTAPTAEVRVNQPGATSTDGQGIAAEYGSLLTVNDHVVLFLRKATSEQSADAWDIVGGSQGRLRLTGDNVTNFETGSGLPIPHNTTLRDLVADLSGS